MQKPLQSNSSPTDLKTTTATTHRVAEKVVRRKDRQENFCSSLIFKKVKSLGKKF
jgi:hypothetical protein